MTSKTSFQAENTEVYNSTPEMYYENAHIYIHGNDTFIADNSKVSVKQQTLPFLLNVQLLANTC